MYCISSYKSKFPQAWFGFLSLFEKNKKAADPSKKNPINIQLPFGIDQEYRHRTGQNLVKVLKQRGPRYNIQFLPSLGALQLKWEAVQSLLDPVVKKVVDAIEKLESCVIFSSFKYLLLVGGFSASPYLQKAVQEKFSREITVLVPEEPQLAIIRGAVRFGHVADEIKSRISKFSYGIRGRTSFIEGYHRESSSIYMDGVKRSDNLFDAIMTKGDTIKRNHKKEKTYGPARKEDTSIGLKVYAMPFQPSFPQYVTDVGIRKLGKGIIVRIPSAQETNNITDRAAKVEFYFGDTEIRVEAYNAFTGDRQECTVDFLQ